MYRVTPKRNGYVVLTADRKQTHKGVFALKKQAIEHMNSLITNQAKINPSKLSFVSAFETFVIAREEVASNPQIRLTITGTSNYRSDLNLRIKPNMDETVLLSTFNYNDMKSLLLKCHKQGHNYKTLRRMVRNIKTFLNVMKSEGKDPCLDMLHFKIDMLHDIVPTDNNEMLEAQVNIIDDETVAKVLVELNKTKDKDYQSAMSFALICISFFFGLRRSEVKGLKRCDVDLKNNTLDINKIYISREGGLLHRTKNRGSFRKIKFGNREKLFFTWWLNYVNKNHSHTDWLFPASTKTAVGPISDKGYSCSFWRTYEKMGLAKLEWHNGHAVIISSAFKGSPSKTFRHRLATILMDALDKVDGINRNYVKSVVGHTRFTTTQDRYGNHNRSISDQTALNKSNLISGNLSLKY